MVGACPAPAVAILVYIGTPMQRHGYRDIFLVDGTFHARLSEASLSPVSVVFRLFLIRLSGNTL